MYFWKYTRIKKGYIKVCIDFSLKTPLYPLYTKAFSVYHAIKNTRYTLLHRCTHTIPDYTSSRSLSRSPPPLTHAHEAAEAAYTAYEAVYEASAADRPFCSGRYLGG